MARVLRYSRRQFLLHLHSRTSERGTKRGRELGREKGLAAGLRHIKRQRKKREKDEWSEPARRANPPRSVYEMRSAKNKTQEIFINSSATNHRSGRTHSNAGIKLTWERYRKRSAHVTDIFPSFQWSFSTYRERRMPTHT